MELEVGAYASQYHDYLAQWAWWIVRCVWAYVVAYSPFSLEIMLQFMCIKSALALRKVRLP